MLFSWVVKINVIKFAAWNLPSVTVAEKALRSQPKAVFLRRNGVISDLDAIYSPVRIRKKYVMIIISLYTIRRWSPDTVTIQNTRQRTWRGVELTRFGVGSCLIKHRY